MKERFEGPTPTPASADGTGPASCVSGNVLYTFVTGTTHAVYMKTKTGTGAWSAWSNIGGIATSGPAACTTSDGAVHVFVRGSDKALYHKSLTNGTWSGWEDLTGIIE